MRTILFAACIVGTASYAYAQQSCETDTNCPCRDWAETLANLEHTANTPGPGDRGCAEVRVHGGETAFSAFRNCNRVFREKNGVTGRDTPAFYNSCSAYVCNWFKAQNPPWSPAC